MIQVAPENSVSIDPPDVGVRHHCLCPQLFGGTRSQVPPAPFLPETQLFGSCSHRPAPKTQLLSAFGIALTAARSPKLSFYQLFSWRSPQPAPPKPLVRHRLLLKLSSYQCFGGHHCRNHGRLNVYQCFNHAPYPQLLSGTSRGLGPPNASHQSG